MKQTVNAIYEQGVFRPLTDPAVPENQLVKLIVDSPADLTPEEMLKLGAMVYEGLSEDEIDEIEQIALENRNLWVEKTA
ncbi:MAG: DUF104 domain-containing protein [Oscillatoria sp. SIO1A7]|nr:DUF104 domain-containing protein [Oscillatoria sp. SIO1A7]